MENLIELKKVAKEMYQLYILLINFLEQGDKNFVYKISGKINECKSKEEEILASLDENTIIDLYNFALNNIDNDNPAYIDKLYLFVIDYFNDKFDLYKDDVTEVRKYAYVYSFKKIFEVIEKDTLDLSSIDNDFYVALKHKLYPCFFADMMLFPKFEELLLNANFDFNSVEYEMFESESVKNECMNLILYAETVNNKIMTAENVINLLKRKYLFEYLVQNLSKEDYSDIKDYLFSLKKENNLIIEFKKVIEEKEKNDKREM